MARGRWQDDYEICRMMFGRVGTSLGSSFKVVGRTLFAFFRSLEMSRVVFGRCCAVVEGVDALDPFSCCGVWSDWSVVVRGHFV